MLIAVAAAVTVAASAPSPFAGPPKPAPKIVRLLAPSGAFTAEAFREFERESGYGVAYDAYGDALRVQAMMKEAEYDVVILSGPTLQRAIAAGQLRKIDKTQIPNSRRIAQPVAAKLTSYDAAGAYGLAWGWSATGLLFDADKVAGLLGGAPNSWAVALTPAVSAKLASCGVALPDARDEMFVAAWRLLRIDPARVREREVGAAADVIVRARADVRLPISRDPISAIAGGAACLTFGAAAQAEIASRRSREGGAGLDIRFVEPREGGPMAIDALAEPRAAPHPKEASALIDYLLRPAVASEATAAAGLTSAEDSVRPEAFRALWPVGVYDAAVLMLVEKEWARTRAPKKPETKPETKPRAKAAAKPARKPTKKPTRTKR